MTVDSQKPLINPSFDRVHQFLRGLDNPSGLGLPIVLGSPARIVETALPNWGVELESGEMTETSAGQRLTIDALRDFATECYFSEWGAREDFTSPSHWSKLIIEATKKSGLVGIYEGLNSTIAEFVRVIFKASGAASDGADHTVLDIGCGAGTTSIATIQTLARSDLARRVRLIVNDLSTESRQIAERSLAPYFPTGSGRLVPTAGPEAVVLPELQSESVDIVISNAVFHHFTNTAYMSRIMRVLKPGGFVVAGDYHTTIWHHPVAMHHFLDLLGASRDFLSQFSIFFKITSESLAQVSEGHSTRELTANEQMIAFWRELSILVARERIRSSHVFEAHESSSQRKAKFAETGFETDPVAMMASFHQEQVDSALTKLRATVEYAATTEGSDERRALERRTITDLLREFPISEMARIPTRIHPYSDIARVTIARKPLRR